uniref:Uncharacterized protein n=1 Tax=Meloidogyne javanica TaxID=6303 RepID=A0A915M8Q7_MELJA
MYTDKFNWDSARHYRNKQLEGVSDKNSSNGQKQRRELADVIAEIVRDSGVLGVKKEVEEERSASAGSSSVPSVIVVDDSSESDPSNVLLPTFEQLHGNLSPEFARRKFFDDLRPLDRLLARVVRTGVTVLHLEVVCTLTRFRRTLLSFMKGKLVPVAYDRAKRFYQVNDYVSSKEFDTSVNFDDCPHISRLRDNPNLAVKFGVHINSDLSALPQLRAKRSTSKPSAEDLRKDQTRRFAMTHVVRGAELTRENKCFEAIQCFNKALNIDEQCVDAYVGRGAASAGLRNFSASLQDLENAIKLQPEHRNANKYQLEVLVAYAKDLEKSGNIREAEEKFTRVLELQPGHFHAVDFFQRMNISDNSRKRPSDVIELDEDEEDLKKGKTNGFNNDKNQSDDKNKKADSSMSEEEAKQNRIKLKEMEEFIRKLRSRK